ncbi:glyceraldehyde-3-phosphate dehydrogenase [Pseudomaricurvus alkylphenolicus]|uniref:type I glyceraldehyde-3-phosphate dehydrogenase n=1 Tax=Pseudomaricurvus alkylphenolicus TaxID=1306991 RepID=UPI00141F1264|nr:glyceraldehyde 3-phosphate dehydrogenase NAD-binding domain-containing protein [Pseudomaricurvus alkylphenolicus]NIB38704.1 glyceraldehyde-3-phosphate dehydrogenase [Pseudomaricurvus alkylphenolicus]
MNKPTRIGIMGFGHIGRHLYRLAIEDDDLEVVAISDIAKPAILHYLLTNDRHNRCDVSLEGNYLINDKFRSRMMGGDGPDSVPWDVFEVDFVVDCTGRSTTRNSLQAHIESGAHRVLTSVLPTESLDRLILPGINDGDINSADQLISAGSSTTNALALVLKVLDDELGVDAASMVTMHAYTSDQSLQDYAGKDFRRSRSGAENIIPNTNASAEWVAKVMPNFDGNLKSSALNVPIQKGSLLDLTVSLKDPAHDVAAVNEAMIRGAEQYPNLLGVAHDPIVSSDIIGNRHSAVYDLKATIKAGSRMVKTLSWYDNGLSHACRMIDALKLYGGVQ